MTESVPNLIPAELAGATHAAAHQRYTSDQAFAGAVDALADTCQAIPNTPQTLEFEAATRMACAVTLHLCCLGLLDEALPHLKRLGDKL